MIIFFKAQIFALILLSILMIMVIVRMPGASNEIIEFPKNLTNYHLVDIKKESSVFYISTSKDPHIILSKIIINRPYKSFLHINVDYLAKSCGARLEEPASFIQIFWRSADVAFSEDKSDAAPISLGRSNYLVPLRSLSRLLEVPASSVELEFRIDIVNKVRCKFRINKIIIGSFKDQ
jgi:hypothetical protein